MKVRFLVEVEVPDADEHAGDPEWFADAAWNALSELGYETSYLFPMETR